MNETGGSSIAQRALAIVVLAVVGWILLKVVIGIVAGIATMIMVVLAVAAVIWALRVL
jgi:hypothetical protein